MRYGRLFGIFVLAAAAVVDGARADGFRTPSDNIHCLAEEWEGEAWLRCDIRASTAPAPMAGSIAFSSEGSMKMPATAETTLIATNAVASTQPQRLRRRHPRLVRAKAAARSANPLQVRVGNCRSVSKAPA